MNHYKIPFQYGLIGAAVMLVTGVLSYIFYESLFSSFFLQSVIGMLSFGVMIFIPVWGIVTFKRSLGSIAFKDAFIGGLIIVAFMLTTSTAFSFVLSNYIDPEYPVQLYEKVTTTTEESMEKLGATDEDIEKTLSRIRLEDFKPTAIGSLRSLGIGMGVGMVLCGVVALFVSRKDPSELNQPKVSQ